MKVRHDEGVANHIGPEPCVVSARMRRSVGRGAHRPAIEPRKDLYPGCRRCCEGGRQHGRARDRECPDGPAWSKNLACGEALCAGTGRSHVRPTATSGLVRIGKARSRSR